MRTLEELTRPNIWHLKPYSSVRDRYNEATASTFLDANGNPYNMSHNHYLDPMQWGLKHELSRIKEVNSEHIFLDSSSGKAIDLVFCTFYESRMDNVVTIDPTYGTYQVCAEANDVEHRKVLLDGNSRFSTDKLLAATDKHTELISLCSPNNPAGDDLLRNRIGRIILGFSGLVTLDEACNDFLEAPSFLSELDKYPNLIILQTFSRAQGCVAIHLGMTFASQEAIPILNRIEYPYNVNQLTQKRALEVLHRHCEIERWVKTPKEERENLEKEFAKLLCTVKIFPSDANFFLMWVMDAVRIYSYLADEGIIIRNHNSVSLRGSCSRVTVGTRLGNGELLEALREI